MIFGKERCKPVAHLVILCLVLGDVHVHDQVVVGRKPCDDDRPLREVPVAADFRDEKRIDGAATEHIPDGIARGKRECFLEEPAKDRRQDEQKACGIMAARGDLFCACNPVGGKNGDDEERKVLAVVKQVPARACDVQTVFTHVKNEP